MAETVHLFLGDHENTLRNTMADLTDHKVVQRIWKYDHTLWKDDPKEIANRLGWLRVAETLRDEADTLKSWAKSIRDEGLTHALLLGIGGSSLASETLHQTFGSDPEFLTFSVLDSTDPGAVLERAVQIDPAKTLFIVSTKSGDTVETRSFLNYFYTRTQAQLGRKDVGSHFIAITDGGSSLEALGGKLEFRRIFLNDPDIGGRYSALSYFGMVPAALMGLDIARLLDSGIRMMNTCEAADNSAARVGAVLGRLALSGRDKATFLFSPEIASLGDWIEQLIAESSGKEKRVGIIPVVGEPPGPPEVYGSDRVFVRITVGEDGRNEKMDALQAAGHPVIRIPITDCHEIGGQFFFWEFATVVACEQLRVNPFDQPHVQTAKTIAREKIEGYRENRKIPRGNALAPDAMALSDFTYQARPGDYIAVQAFVHPTSETDAALAELRDYLRRMTRLAVTVGYGPRFLHSTGQLHKGDSGKGLFVQLISDIPKDDPPIPVEPGSDESLITFGILKTAQALGDYEALLNADRRAIRFDLGADVPSGIRQLTGG
ncbi:MAG TPA: glucose-6-phosphate isomerase [bacterium]|nr:glucose-6-phosphate isomerase [bacterium]